MNDQNTRVTEAARTLLATAAGNIAARVSLDPWKAQEVASDIADTVQRDLHRMAPGIERDLLSRLHTALLDWQEDVDLAIDRQKAVALRGMGRLR